MQLRPSLIILPLSLLLATGLAGCGDGSDGGNDTVAKINADYTTVLRERPIIRIERGSTDESAEELRRLATRADTIGRSDDARAAANLAANIRSAAGSFEFDEAIRMESSAQSLRTIIRSLAADAELLHSAAMAAESMDTSAANLVLESNLADARSRIAAAEDQLDALNERIKQASGQRDSRIARATAMELTAGERGRTGIDAGPLDGLESRRRVITSRFKRSNRPFESRNPDARGRTTFSIAPDPREKTRNPGGTRRWRTPVRSEQTWRISRRPSPTRWPS